MDIVERMVTRRMGCMLPSMFMERLWMLVLITIIVRVHVHVCGHIGYSWVNINDDIDGNSGDDYTGYYIFVCGDGNTVAVGDPYDDENGINLVHVRVITTEEPTEEPWLSQLRFF